MDRTTLAAMGAQLRARRAARGVTRAALADAVGSRPVIIGRWERGEAVPTPEEARALARALELPPRQTADWEPAARAGALAGAGLSSARWWVGPRSRPAAWWRRLSSLLGRGRPAGEPEGQEPEGAARSYLDDPVERRRYTVRGALTLAALAAMAVLLMWLLGELADGWGALLDLFRLPPAPGGSAGALGLLGRL